MVPKCPASAPQAPAKPPKQRGDTSGAGVAAKPLAGLSCLPPDLRAFLRNRSVTEIAELLQLGKGTASRIKRGIYPHAPNKLLKRWESVRAAGAVPVGTWALRRVMTDAKVHEAVLWGGMLYIWMMSLIFYRYTFFPFSPGDLSPPYWINMGAMAISTLLTVQALFFADGGLLAQTLDLPPQRLPLTPVGEAGDAA